MIREFERRACDFEVADDPVAADLASIRAVQGPRDLDLTTDLSRLAAYDHSPQWRPVLREDKRRRRRQARDAREARLNRHPPPQP